jgi:hypothetical protein
MTVTTGVLGRAWRADVSSWGSVVPWDGRPPLDWFVAAEDRWHVPSAESAVRQRRVDGTAVVETRLRIPHGDAVQRVYSVAEGGGLTIVEVENESPSPIAVAFGHREVRTERPIADVPIEGIDLQAGAFVLPVGHRASARVGLAHDGPARGTLPSRLPAVDRVVHGWTSVLERAGRLQLPVTSSSLVDAVAARRCELLLVGPPRADDDAAGFAVAAAELARLGEPIDPWLLELAEAVAAVARVDGWDADAALHAAGRVLHLAGERRAVRDLQAILARRTPSPPPPLQPDGTLATAWLEQRLARDGDLLPAGFPPDWLGADFEVHRLPVSFAATVSFAIRWHGDRPAILWEIDGPPVQLRAPVVAPGWSTDAPTGESLWPPPP